jgi:hypothetical protein
MSNRCPLEGTHHYPCGVMPDDHDSKECQFLPTCQMLLEDMQRFNKRIINIKVEHEDKSERSGE